MHRVVIPLKAMEAGPNVDLILWEWLSDAGFIYTARLESLKRIIGRVYTCRYQSPKADDRKPYGEYHFYFNDPDCAVMFKLAWGGV